MDKQLAENNKDSQHLFMQKISSLRYPGKHTIYDATQQDLDVLSAEKLTQLYERYISNKTDFTYFITGDIQPAMRKNCRKISGICWCKRMAENPLRLKPEHRKHH